MRTTRPAPHLRPSIHDAAVPARPAASRLRLRPLCAALLLAGCAGLPAWACEGPAAKLVSKEGTVELRTMNQAEWRPAAPGQSLCTGDTLAVRHLGRAAVVLPNDVVLRLDQGSVLTLGAFAADRPSELNLLQGALHVLTRFSKRFGILTPYLNAMVDGTEFTVSVGANATSVSVTEGRVRAVNEAGEQRLGAGFAARAAQGEAPAPLTLRPLDAVQWALYFPQVVQPSAQELEALSPAARAAAQLAFEGRYTQALEAWPADDTAATQLRPARAGWLLALGRVTEAEALLSGGQQNAEAWFSGEKQDPNAMAVRAILQVIRHRRADAESIALQAAALAPDLAAPQLALSHALQAGRDLPAALEAALAATSREPDHAVAWARLAELQLSSGQLSRGEASARRAAELNPRTPRAQALLGFAQLLRGKLGPAQETLQAAQSAFPSDPLPHLGLGLVHLRSNRWQEGRRDIEVAVMLDPGNADLRAWLARAYLGEGRDRLGTEQLGLSRGLDPRNPTPWFIDGMRLQRASRPVEAAGSFQQALDLNDQRAVVRPVSLLDTDRAARTAALASVWRDLGFDDKMRTASRLALAEDPQSAAAHRLLADAYAATPRNETARVSELLQAQLRQSPRTEPVAPQELVPGLPVLNGPRALSLQESSPLFDERRGGARLGVLGGNRGTWGTAATAWVGLGDGQLSVGHFHYESDGVKPEGDVSLNANNVLWQTAVTPELNAQVELRDTRRRAGDITQRLVDDPTVQQNRARFDSQAARVGLRYAPTAEREWLGSFVSSWRDSSTFVRQQSGPGTFSLSGDSQQKAKLAELMYTDRVATAQWSLGVSGYREDRDDVITRQFTGVPFPATTEFLSNKTQHNLAFVYGSLRPSPPLLLSGGLTVDHYQRGPIQVNRTNAKGGLALSPTPNLTLRGALFETTKGSRLKEQSIEPTQFNGFNQVFDDPDGTYAKQLGIGIDHRPGANVDWGFESLFRRLTIPTLTPSPVSGCNGPVCDVLADEDLHRIHVGARLGTRWALKLAVQNERQRMLTPGQPFQMQMPSELETTQVPVRATYFSAAGWSAYAQLRAVRQAATDANPAKAASAHFTLADAGVKYQTGWRKVTLWLDVANLFDRKFRYQDTYINDDPRIPNFQPGRTANARMELRF